MFSAADFGFRRAKCLPKGSGTIVWDFCIASDFSATPKHRENSMGFRGLVGAALNLHETVTHPLARMCQNG